MNNIDALNVTSKVIDELQKELHIGDVVIGKEIQAIVDKITKEFPNADFKSNQVKAKIIAEIKPTMLSKARISEETYDKASNELLKPEIIKKDSEIKQEEKDQLKIDKDLITMVNNNADDSKKAFEYLKRALASLDLTQEELQEIITYIKSKYTNEEILNDVANKEIENIKVAIYLERASVSKSTEPVKNEVIKREKKPKNKKELIKKIITFVIAGSMSLTVISELYKNIERHYYDSEANEAITSYINTVDPFVQEANTRYVSYDSPSLIARNTIVNGNGYVIQDNQALASDISEFPDASVLDSVIMNAYMGMSYDLETKLRNLDELLKNLKINENALSYMSHYVDCDQDLINKYEEKGFNGLTMEEKEEVDKLEKQFRLSRVEIYKEDLDKLQGLGENNGPSRS